MSEEHEHAPLPQIRYTVYLAEPTVWGTWAAPLVIEGVGSSKQADELIIRTESGFYSFNYARVRFFLAETI